MAKQLYDYWFVQFDFPNEEGKPYKSSGGKMVWNETLKREIPEGWENKNINQLSESVRGVSYDNSQLVDESKGILVLRGNNIENNKLVFDSNVAYVPEAIVSVAQRIKKNEIIITMSSGSKEHIGKCAMFHEDSIHTFGAFLNKFTPNSASPHFLFLFMNSEFFKLKIKSICSGTGINNLTNRTFDEISLAYPSNNIMADFEKLVSPIFSKIGNNEKSNFELTEMRNKLLPLLMNGQVTIKQ